MFGDIARHYDLLNHLLSANLDRRWRRATAGELSDGPLDQVLDLCGGTGDLTLELARRTPAGSIVCCDFSHPMLARADSKFRRSANGNRCILLEADGLRLPFGNATFDAVTVAFGVRNFSDLQTGLAEIHRVLRPQGRLVVLEFSRPAGPILSRAYGFYLRRILPLLGNGATGGGAYTYLARTIADFPEPARLAGRIREAGFGACGWKCLTGGIVAVHTAHK